MTQGEIWMLVLTALMAAGTIGALIVMIIALNKRQEVQVQQPLDVQLIDTLASKKDLEALAARTETELDELWSTVRGENTAIRREITEAVQHSQELLMHKLEANRAELSHKLDDMPDRVIATLKNTGAI